LHLTQYTDLQSYDEIDCRNAIVPPLLFSPLRLKVQ
jgi:hypothetical protein